MAVIHSAKFTLSQRTIVFTLLILLPKWKYLFIHFFFKAFVDWNYIVFTYGSPMRVWRFGAVAGSIFRMNSRRFAAEKTLISLVLLVKSIRYVPVKSINEEYALSALAISRPRRQYKMTAGNGKSYVTTLLPHKIHYRYWYP